MVRARLASLTLAATAALASSGCLAPAGQGQGGFLSRLNLFHRAPDCNRAPDCCCMEGDFVAANGPVTTEGPVLVVPQQTGPAPAPMTGQPPRIITVPQQQAPSVPYSPTGLKK